MPIADSIRRVIMLLQNVSFPDGNCGGMASTIQKVNNESAACVMIVARKNKHPGKQSWYKIYMVVL